jgi:hypothetical protein
MPVLLHGGGVLLLGAFAGGHAAQFVAEVGGHQDRKPASSKK